MNKNYANNMWLRRNADVITPQRLYDNRHIVDWKFATRYFGTDIDESWLDPNEPDSLYYYIDWYYYSATAPKLTYRFVMDNFDNFYYPILKATHSVLISRYQDIFDSMYKHEKLGHRKVHRYINDLQVRIDNNYALFIRSLERINEISLDLDIGMSFQELHKLNNELMSILNAPLFVGTSIQYKYYNLVSDFIDTKYDITYISDKTKRYKINVIA